MKNKPLVSVIVPLYNYAQYIEKCVHSILGQTYDNLRVIVVNNGSLDDGRDKVAAIHDSRLHILDIEKNNGWPPALNLGSEHTAGEWTHYFTADDSLHPTFYERLLSEAEAVPCDLVGAWIRPVDDLGVPSEEAARLHDVTNYRDFTWTDFRNFAWAMPLQGNSFLWKADLFRKVMPAPNVIPADWAITLRAIRERISARIVPEKLIDYRWHGANTGVTMNVINYRIQFAYVHLTEYRPTAAVLASDPEAELLLSKQQLRDQAYALFDDPELIAGLLIASEHGYEVRDRWPTIEDFQAWLKQPLAEDHMTRPALKRLVDHSGKQTTELIAAHARAERLREELDRTKDRAARLREELDKAKRNLRAK